MDHNNPDRPHVCELRKKEQHLVHFSDLLWTSSVLACLCLINVVLTSFALSKATIPSEPIITDVRTLKEEALQNQKQMILELEEIRALITKRNVEEVVEEVQSIKPLKTHK